MIKLLKLEMPTILEEKGMEWTREYLDYKNSGNPIPENVGSRYRHPDIKSLVQNECRDKCMYCESKVTHAYFGDIEHILPKDTFPKLIHSWENLGFACSKCNNFKSNKYDSLIPFINPYKDDPSQHFTFIGSIIMSINGSERAKSTEAELELNRRELIERRHELLMSVIKLAESLDRANEPLKKSLIKELKTYSEPDKEYSAMISDFLKNRAVNSSS